MTLYVIVILPTGSVKDFLMLVTEWKYNLRRPTTSKRHICLFMHLHCGTLFCRNVQTAILRTVNRQQQWTNLTGYIARFYTNVWICSPREHWGDPIKLRNSHQKHRGHRTALLLGRCPRAPDHQPTVQTSAEWKLVVINGNRGKMLAAAAAGDVNWMKYSEGACDETRVLGRRPCRHVGCVARSSRPLASAARRSPGLRSDGRPIERCNTRRADIYLH